jgi:hypothetical protein
MASDGPGTAQKFRRIADEIHKKFSFFHLDGWEFVRRCMALQRCGAGIVLGYADDDFDVRIVAVEKNTANCEKNAASYENLPIGNFGEIVFRKSVNFTHTGLYGFFDQRARVWCCGEISRTFFFHSKRYFPYCIEPLFEELWWVKLARLSAKNDGSGGTEPLIAVDPIDLMRPITKFFSGNFKKKLAAVAKRFKLTSEITRFRIN